MDKGPRVPALLRFLRREGALAVRGNHDDAMLGFVHRLGGRTADAAAAAGSEEEGVDAGERDAASSSAGAPPAQLPIAEWAADPQSAVASLPAEYAYLQYLGARDIRYLHERPYSLRAPEQGLVMVHAGLFPGRPLRSQVRARPHREGSAARRARRGAALTSRRLGRLPPMRQALADLLNVRTVRPANPASGAPARASAENDEPGALPWAALYRGEEGHVVFGHDARLGLQRWPFATGLDSGCVYGGNLSALIVPDGARLGRRRWPFAAGLEGGCATGGNASARVAADGGAVRAARTTPGAGPDSAPAPGPAAAAPSRAGEAGAEAEQPCILSVRAARAYY